MTVEHQLKLQPQPHGRAIMSVHQAGSSRASSDDDGSSSCTWCGMGACVPFPFWRLSDIWLAPQNKADGCHRTTTGCVRCIPDALRQYWRCIGQDGLLAEQAATLKGAMAAHARNVISNKFVFSAFGNSLSTSLPAAQHAEHPLPLAAFLIQSLLHVYNHCILVLLFWWRRQRRRRKMRK